MCTHLSIHILLSQSSFGSAEPGSVNRTVEIINQSAAGKKEGLILFKVANLSQYKNKGARKGPLVLTNYRTKTTIAIVDASFSYEKNYDSDF